MTRPQPGTRTSALSSYREFNERKCSFLGCGVVAAARGTVGTLKTNVNARFQGLSAQRWPEKVGTPRTSIRAVLGVRDMVAAEGQPKPRK